MQTLMLDSGLIRYARVHRALAILAATTAVVALSALFGGTPIAVPSIGSGGVTTGIPFRRELPLLSGVFLTAALDGAMSKHEEMGATAMHRYRLAYCFGLTLAVCALSFSVEALAVGVGAGAVFVRSIVIWFGLALLSARLLGPQLGWPLPLASALLLIWYPQTWWDWTSKSATDLFSWTVAAVALAVGVAASAATPWRTRGWLRR
ncbi:hypothetical protein RM717_12675 [Streptomyces griseus]|uniref:Integral membrane protein n=1 Tax=Streptomyces stephensoniae TaxID=3375367 RepID=A0ABU2W0J1_9ACTN|nr:hypothetical protein [Streptomyces griseus]MDT0491359.1 hypothetical protein [Streptomyces griseus]